MTDTKAKDNFERALEDYKYTTGQVSDLIKYIGFGLLAAFYTTKGDVADLAEGHWLELVHLATGLSAALIIFADYLHYLFASRTSHDAVLNVDNQFQFDRKSANYRLRRYFYYLKQFFTAVGAALVVVLILYL